MIDAIMLEAKAKEIFELAQMTLTESPPRFAYHRLAGQELFDMRFEVGEDLR